MSELGGPEGGSVDCCRTLEWVIEASRKIQWGIVIKITEICISGT